MLDIYRKTICTNNNKLKKLKMAKKVLRYTEEQFITLLENIVKKVKAEEALNESKKLNRDGRRQSLNERFQKLK